MKRQQQSSQRSRSWLTTQRIEALTDGIFAIAMTLLVLNLHLPKISSDLAAKELSKQLFGLWPHFQGYATSFILLAVFWIVHHKQFRAIKRANEVSLWMNILALLFVALIPFSTSLSGEYGNQQIAVVFFECNLLAAGLIFYLQWRYATNNHRLVDPGLDPQSIALARKRNLFIPIVSLLAIGVSFISPEWSTTTYLIIPLLHKYI